MNENQSESIGELAKANKAFEAWWYSEGSGMPPLADEDAETHVRRICKVAWIKAQSCPMCGGLGGVDSGGVTPWGISIMIPCPSCSPNKETTL